MRPHRLALTLSLTLVTTAASAQTFAVPLGEARHTMARDERLRAWTLLGEGAVSLAAGVPMMAATDDPAVRWSGVLMEAYARAPDNASTAASPLSAPPSPTPNLRREKTVATGRSARCRRPPPRRLLPPTGYGDTPRHPMATTKTTAPKKPAVKSPFALHPAVRARSNLPTLRAQDVVLSPDGAIALVIDGRAVRLFDTRRAEEIMTTAPLCGAPAEHVAWSPEGDRVATIVRPDNDGGVLTIWAFPSGDVLHRVEVPRFGSFSHGMPGVTAPVLIFDDAGTTLFVRSTTDLKPEASALWRVDVATGAASSWCVPVKALIESVVIGPRGVLFLCLTNNGDKPWSAWTWGADAPLVALDGMVGYDSVIADGRVWVTGHERWVYAIDWRALRADPTASIEGGAVDPDHAQAKTRRAARIEELAGRARSGRELEYFKWRRAHEAQDEDEDLSGSPWSSRGVRAYLHTEPFPTVQCARLGRGVLVRDGVSLCALDLFRDRVVETRLAEDLRKCAPDGARMRSVSVGGSVVAIVWDKTLGGTTALVSVLDVDLPALGLA